jgi:hypothetical protein
VNSAEAYARLRAIGRPILSSAEASVAWNQEESATTHALRRLADAGLVQRVRTGLWAVGEIGDPLDAAYFLTRPYPSYGSTWTALFRHGLIEQIPRSIYVVSLDRAQTISTSLGQFVVQHIHPALYGGMERSGWHDLATPEKALFDTVYLLSARHGNQVTLPEVTLSDEFDEKVVDDWVERISSKRLQTIMRIQMRRILGEADRETREPLAPRSAPVFRVNCN